MGQPNPPGAPYRRLSLGALLEFRPWMLALAVLLACAIGVAVMNQLSRDRAVWAQANQVEPAGR